MERLKGYVIRLEDFTDSMAWAQHAYVTGTKWGWDLDFYPGTNGRLIRLQDHAIMIYPKHKKCAASMQRPGVQGCFLSHWRLWNQCLNHCLPMFIFEHDVEFCGPPPDIGDINCDVIKFEGFRPSKPLPAGQWWEGARAYAITPVGAKKLIDWVKCNGAMPADCMLCDGIVDIKFDHHNRVVVKQNQFSFTRDLS